MNSARGLEAPEETVRGLVTGSVHRTHRDPDSEQLLGNCGRSLQSKGCWCESR